MLYHDVHRNEQAEKDLGARQVDLDTLLRESDFVSVHTDLNEQTRGLFNADAVPEDEARRPCSSTRRAARWSIRRP